MVSNGQGVVPKVTNSGAAAGDLGLCENLPYVFRGPNAKGLNILESILGAPCFGKLLNYPLFP